MTFLKKKKQILDFNMEKRTKSIIAKNIKPKGKKVPNIDEVIKKQMKKTPHIKARKVI